jgi:cyclase
LPVLKTRIIPTLLYRDPTLVKGVGFDSWRRVGAPQQAIRVYNLREVDELVFLDISATREGRMPDFELIDELADNCFMPFTVGGGLRNIEDVREVLRIGADKVCLNSALFESPDLVCEVASRFGSQCLVASIDYRETGDGTAEVFSCAGTKAEGKKPEKWACELADRGAGEILLTSIERDGTMDGYGLEILERVSRAVSIPVIVSGGAGSYHHFREGIEAGASALAAASMFHFTQNTPKEAKLYLREHGVPVRIVD